MPHFRNLALVFLLLPLWLACNSVFYQPDSEDGVTPTDYKLEFEDFTVKSEDGATVTAWKIKPKLKDKNGPLGTVIHFHGNAENMTTHVGYVQWLAEEGYYVVTFDYRGYGKSTKEPSRDGLVLDGVAVLKYVASEPVLGKLPGFVIGQSLGGAVAIPSYVEANVSNIRAVVVESTFGSYRGITRDKLASFWPTWLFQWPLSFLVSDGKSPLDYVEQFKAPLLVIHGTHDKVVSFEMGKELFDAAQNPDKTFWEIPGGGHTPAFGKPRSPYRPRLLEYFRRYLGTSAAKFAQPSRS